jgi:hypothetical protein
MLILSKVIDDDLRYHSWKINFRPAAVSRLKKKHASDIMFIPESCTKPHLSYIS